MIHKLTPILIGLFICICPLQAFAAECGSIGVSLPKDMEGETMRFTKEGEKTQTVTVDKHGIAMLENLSVGTYQIEIPETSEYIFMPVKVSIPTWSEEEHNMLYNITVIPKYVQKEKVLSENDKSSPLTSDRSNSTIYIRVGIISLIILVIISCHNRFNCDTMTVKYSINGGHNNGNDNDTENPRSTCRIGISSSGSID